MTKDKMILSNFNMSEGMEESKNYIGTVEDDKYPNSQPNSMTLEATSYLLDNTHSHSASKQDKTILHHSQTDQMTKQERVELNMKCKHLLEDHMPGEDY